MRTFYEQSVSVDGTVCYFPVSGDEGTIEQQLRSAQEQNRRLAQMLSDSELHLSLSNATNRNKDEALRQTDKKLDEVKGVNANLENRLANISSICGKPGASLEYIESIVKARIEFAERQLEALKKELLDLQSSFNLAAGHRDHYQKLCQQYSKALEDINVELGYSRIEGATISIDGLVSLVRKTVAGLHQEIMFCKNHASGINDELVALKKETDIIRKQRDDLIKAPSAVLTSAIEAVIAIGNIGNIDNRDRLREAYDKWRIDSNAKEYAEKNSEPKYSDIEKEIEDGIAAIKEGRYNIKGLGPLVAEAIENLFKLRNYR